MLNQLNIGPVDGVRSVIMKTIDFKGYYRIRYSDDHGNISDWIEFAFNPAIIEGEILIDSTSVFYQNESILTNKDVFIRWNNIENFAYVYRNGSLYCQTERPNGANYCGQYNMVYETDGAYQRGTLIEDNRTGFPYSNFTSGNFTSQGVAISDGQQKQVGTTYYIYSYNVSTNMYVSENDYILETNYYQPVTITNNVFGDFTTNEFYVNYDGQYVRYENLSIYMGLPKYVKLSRYVIPNSQQYSSIFHMARVKLESSGDYVINVCNRIDTGKCIERLYTRESSVKYYKNDTGNYILAEHYTKNELTDEYIPVDFKTEVGQLKETGTTYYFAVESNEGVMSYFEDNGYYISKYHYTANGSTYTQVNENLIGTPKVSSVTYYVKDSILSFEVDKIPPSGYQDDVYIIYDGNTPSSEKYKVPFSLSTSTAYTENKITNSDGISVVGVINNNLRLIWSEHDGVSALRYSCTYIGVDSECFETTIQSFQSYLYEGTTYYYYDFLYKAKNYETRYEFRLLDLAGNEGETYIFTIAPRTQLGRIYYLNQNDEKVYLDRVNSTNIKN